MSQFWHANWAEHCFKPSMLGNWEVPNWHPKWPCIRHCATTKFLAEKSGRLLPDQPRSKRSPWGDFKGTWELPLKIDRKLAEKLSQPPKYKLIAWESHKKRYEGPCGIVPADAKKNRTGNNEGGKVRTKQRKPGKTAGGNTKMAEKTIKAKERRPVENSKSAERKKANNIPKKRIQKPKDKDKNVAKKEINVKEPAEDMEIIETKEKKMKKKEKEMVDEEEEIVREDSAKSVESETKEYREETKEYREETKEYRKKTKEYRQETKEYREETKEYQEDKVDREEIIEYQEAKVDRKIQCRCKGNSQSSAEVPKPKRNICTLHQRLRV